MAYQSACLPPCAAPHRTCSHSLVWEMGQSGPSGSWQLVAHKREERLTRRRVLLSIRGILTGWRKGLTGTSCSSTRGRAKSWRPGHGRTSPCTSKCWGTPSWKAAVQTPGLTVDAKLTDFEPEKCPWGKGGQVHPGLQQGKHWQQVEVGGPSPLLGPSSPAGAPQCQAEPAILERTLPPVPRPLSVGLRMFVPWAQNVGQLEPTATRDSSTELCWHAGALGGGRIWPSSTEPAPAPRFPSPLSPTGPRPWSTARVLLSRAGWARPTAAAAPGGLSLCLGDTRARPGPAAAFLMPAALCSAGRLSPTPSRC